MSCFSLSKMLLNIYVYIFDNIYKIYIKSVSKKSIIFMYVYMLRSFSLINVYIIINMSFMSFMNIFLFSIEYSIINGDMYDYLLIIFLLNLNFECYISCIYNI
jgi:hypothetical protein